MFLGKCKILCSSLLIAASVTMAVPSNASMAANVNQKNLVNQGNNQVTVIPVQSEKQLEQKNLTSSGRISDKIQGILNKDNASNDNYKDNGPVKPYDLSENNTSSTISYYNNYGDDSIMGAPIATEEQCVKDLLQNNPNPQICVSPEELVRYYY